MRKFITLICVVVLFLSGCGADGELTDHRHYKAVSGILTEAKLPQTASAVTVYEPGLHSSGNTASNKEDSAMFMSAQLCSQMELNPVAGFRALVSGGLFEPVETGDSGLRALLRYSDVGASAFLPFRVEGSASAYPFTLEGCQRLIRDILALSSVQDGCVDVAGVMLPQYRDGVHWSGEDNCYYAYYLYYGDYTAHAVCIYLRGEQEITDLEMQFLNMKYNLGGAAGSGLHNAAIRIHCEMLETAFIAAAEVLLTGKTQIGAEMAQLDWTRENVEYEVPGSYRLGCFGVTITREYFLTHAADPEWEGDTCELTTYRIQNDHQNPIREENRYEYFVDPGRKAQ